MRTHAMNHDQNLLWLSVSPHLKCFDRRLLSRLAKIAPVRQWEYSQTVDESCCVDSVVAALHNYLSDTPQEWPCHRAALKCQSDNEHYKVHLLGHGVSGVVGLLYARQHPERVASLTLLSVNAAPAVNWQAHYYALRQLLPCSREIILAQMSRSLFGNQPARFSKALAHLLAKDLDSNLTFHSLAHNTSIPAGSTKVPLLVCNGEKDAIVCSQGQSEWRKAMKPSDRLWQCPEGHHFFHFHHAESVTKAIQKHIDSASVQIQPRIANRKAITSSKDRELNKSLNYHS